MTSTINTTHTEENIYNELYYKLVIKIKNNFPDIKLNHKILFQILKIIIELLDFYDMTGEQKRELALKILRRYVNESIMSDIEKNLCNILIDDGTLSETINIIISATRGEFDIKDATELGLTVLERLLIFMLKKLRERKKRRKKRRNIKKNKKLKNITKL
jgi:hypothetical protein